MLGEKALFYRNATFYFKTKYLLLGETALRMKPISLEK